MTAPQWHFADFRLDPAKACLWRGTEAVALPPKAFDVLQYLVTHADRVVSQDTLLEAVWPETAVSDTVVRMAIGALRRALGDTAQAPRFIATVPRRGYRFVAPVVDAMAAGTGRADAPGMATPATPGPAEEPPPAPVPLPEAERRQLTVLCCALVGATALAARLDPEDYRDVVRAYHQCCAEVLQQFDGYLAHALDEHVLGYFGYPMAHEDDAQRAVRTGLGLLHAMDLLNTRVTLPAGDRIAVRLGIHTGLVVVGDVGAGTRHAPLALGETSHIATRLPHLAGPHTLVISAATQQLVAGYFRWKALGAQTLPDLTQPLEVYRVLGASAAQSRLEVAATHGLTPLVGRAHEVGLLLTCWTRVAEGMGQVVLLGGEPGIGKSRLVQVLKEHVADAGYPWLECQGSPYYQHTALYPLTDLVARRLLPEAPVAQQVQHLEAFLRQQGLVLTETVPLLAPLLALPLPPTYAPVQMAPEQQRQQTLHVLLRLLLRLATAQPLLLVMEDLHWMDPSTLEWLSLLVDQGPTTRILALCTFRPDFVPPWTVRSHLTQMTLARLPQRQVTALTHQVAHGKALPAEVVAQIVAKTDGVPLFVEEVTKTILESGLLQEREDHYALTGPLLPLAIPVTLHDALLARLDRLGAAKGLVQLGATLGREFPYALLQAVAPWDEETVRRELQQLVKAELLYQRGLPPQATYIFKHTLIQDTAYQSLLKRTRQQYHQCIAQVLEAQFPDTAETQPELLAYHYTEAGLNVQAIGYWQRAGGRAIERSAHVEAISHLTRGLKVLTTMPETPERLRHELDLQVPLGAAWVQTRGWSAPEVGQAYARARELCQRLGEPPQLPAVLLGQIVSCLQRAEWRTAHELAEHLLTLAQRQSDPIFLLSAHTTLGAILFSCGEMAAAHTHVTQASTMYVSAYHHTLVARYGYDLGVFARCYVALSLWLLGAPEQALAQMQAARTLAQEIAHPFSLAFALHYLTRLYQWRKEVPAALTCAEAMIALSAEHRFEQFLSIGRLLHGWALVTQGQTKEGLNQMRQSLTDYLATGAAAWRPHYLAMLAEGYEQVGAAASFSRHEERGLSLLSDL